jgi:hypothetical protein
MSVCVGVCVCVWVIMYCTLLLLCYDVASRVA